MATNQTSSSNPRAEKMGDVLDVLSSGIAKTAASELKSEPLLLVPEVPAEPTRELLADRKSNRMRTSMAQDFGIPSLTLGLLGC